MTRYEKVAQATKDIHAALIAAKLIDGSSLEEDEIRKIEKTIFWPDRCDLPDATAKRTFAVVSIHGLDDAEQGDDGSAQTATAYIDLYTLSEADDPRFVKEVAGIEKALERNGWDCEPLLPVEYDPQTQRHQLTLSAEKIYR